MSQCGLLPAVRFDYDSPQGASRAHRESGQVMWSTIRRTGSEGAVRQRRRGRTALATVTLSALVLGGSLGVPATASAADDAPFITGPSDADLVAVLSGVNNKSGGPGTQFWWNHTNLTVAVTAAPEASPDGVRALRNAVATWSGVLARRLPMVSLVDVTGTSRSRAADIVVHYVPHAGGVAWGGNAICGSQHCSNVIIKSEEPPGGPYPDFDNLRIYRMGLHELGHALGLGHASPLNTSTDIMAYGWANVTVDPLTGNYLYDYRTPILSDCDIAGIAAAFAWALNGEAPHPATVAFVTC